LRFAAGARPSDVEHAKAPARDEICQQGGRPPMMIFSSMVAPDGLLEEHASRFGLAWPGPQAAWAKACPMAKPIASRT